MMIHVLIPCVYVGEVKWLSNEVVTVTSSLCRDRCAILDDQLARLSETYGSLIILRKVNILTNPFFKILYNLANAPVIIVFQTGKEIGRLEDDLSWGAITDIIDTVSLRPAPFGFHAAALGFRPNPLSRRVNYSLI